MGNQVDHGDSLAEKFLSIIIYAVDCSVRIVGDAFDLKSEHQQRVGGDGCLFGRSVGCMGHLVSQFMPFESDECSADRTYNSNIG